MTDEISILVVDDSAAIRAVLTELLKDLGVESVSECADGEEALRKISSDPMSFDAVFVDLHMEGMDGLELMKKLHDIRFPGGVVVMSALESRILEFTLEVISNYNLRVLGSVEKPFEKSLIAFMVKRIRNFVPPYLYSDNRLLKRREVIEAIQANRVKCYFQPKISRSTNKVVGVECLARIQTEDGTILSPNKFIPVAEKFGLIDSLTDAIFMQAIPEYQQLIEVMGKDCTLSVNISPNQLYNDTLPDMMSEYVNRFNIRKSQLYLEITENYAVRDENQLKNLNRLGIHGFSLSLDDYGAGYTNLRQLKNFPFKEIKIDAQLVQGICRDRVLTVIVESVRNVTRELGLKLVAEGVESPEDLKVLDMIRVDTYQGFLFCRPKPVGELLRWYHVWQESNSSSAAC